MPRFTCAAGLQPKTGIARPKAPASSRQITFVANTAVFRIIPFNSCWLGKNKDLKDTPMKQPNLLNRIPILERIFASMCVLSLLGAPAEATPLNRWSIECGVDSGSIVKRGNLRIFRTSSNQCPGGVFNQRAEIGSQRVKPDHKGTYLFSTTLSMTNNRNEKFTIFQIADGRNGCAPPLSVNIQRDGGIKLRADYKTGPGESCVRNVLRHTVTPIRLARDGRKQQFDVLIDFLGDGRFDVQVALDGKVAAQGQYRPPAGRNYIVSKFFYFKHGVYSQNSFSYEMKSEGMTVKRIHRK